MEKGIWFMGALLLLGISMNMNGQTPRKRKHKASVSCHKMLRSSQRLDEAFAEAVGNGPDGLANFIATTPIEDIDQHCFLPTILEFKIPASSLVAFQLLDAGASINVRGKDGRTPLMIVLENGATIEVIKEFVTRGADVTLQDNHQRTVLRYAVETHDLEIVKFLFEELEKRIFKAVADNWNTCPGALIEHEIMPFVTVPDIDKADDDGSSPLMYASWLGDFRIVEFLLEKGANVFARNDKYEGEDGRNLNDLNDSYGVEETALWLAQVSRQCMCQHGGRCQLPAYCQLCVNERDSYDKTIFLLENAMQQNAQYRPLQ
jgi:ankyrin repeat protein